MHVAKMRMLRWMYSHTRSDKIRNEDIQRKVEVTSVVDNMREARLKWLAKCVDAPVMRCKRSFTEDMTLARKVWRTCTRVEDEYVA
ncbi:hypothetical protein H5410_052317 [Solanum commersonii]|uniref:Uncharacterized protein n=1 Tax=Solanum commersonii TaxID=4109 RepID=A0A9J5X136_SOLCO|nr:hypothetical protein H5410_052317 [Solanum commersonii]